MKEIYIFLSRTESIASKIVHFFTKTKYTHASFALDENLVELYSSGRKNGIKMFPAGPTQESLYRGFFGRDDHTPCIVYSLLVEDEVFSKVKTEIAYYMEHINEYSFSVLGIAACKFGIAWKRKNKFFCSQFVAEVLTKCGAINFDKPNSLVHPRDYQKLPDLKLVFEGTVGELRSIIEKRKVVTV